MSFGGGYTIGFQTVADSLDDGPLDEQLPAALVEEIHAYLVEHLRQTAWVELAAVVADPGRFLEVERGGVDGDGFLQYPVAADLLDQLALRAVKSVIAELTTDGLRPMRDKHCPRTADPC